jgi:hypothetical protein
MTPAERAELAAVETLRAALSAQFSTRVTVGRADRFRGDPAFVAAVGGRLGPLSYDGPLGALRALGAGHLPEVRA